MPASTGNLVACTHMQQVPLSVGKYLARIFNTISVVEEAAATGITIAPAAPIVHTPPNGMILDLTAEQYARDWALPQFYFTS